jgi:hypothetical protein
VRAFVNRFSGVSIPALCEVRVVRGLGFELMVARSRKDSNDSGASEDGLVSLNFWLRLAIFTVQLSRRVREFKSALYSVFKICEDLSVNPPSRWAPDEMLAAGLTLKPNKND